MKLVKKVVAIVEIALIVLVEVYLVWFYLQAQIMAFSFNQGIVNGQNLMGQTVLQELQNTGQLKLNVDDQVIVLTPEVLEATDEVVE